MKTSTLFIAAILISAFGFTQKLNVPKAAQEDLSKRFANATVAKWEAAGKGYEAEWRENGKEIAVVYDAAGKYVMTEREIDLATLPAVVVDGLMQHFPSAQVQEAETQERSTGNITYQVEFKYNGKTFETTLDANGQSLNSIPEGAEGTEGSSQGSDGSDGSDED